MQELCPMCDGVVPLVYSKSKMKYINLSTRKWEQRSVCGDKCYKQLMKHNDLYEKILRYWHKHTGRFGQLLTIRDENRESETTPIDEYLHYINMRIRDKDWIDFYQ